MDLLAGAHAKAVAGRAGPLGAEITRFGEGQRDHQRIAQGLGGGREPGPASGAAVETGLLQLARIGLVRCIFLKNGL